MAKAGALDDLDLDGVSDDRAVELVTYTYDSQGNRASAEHKSFEVYNYQLTGEDWYQTSHTLTEYLVDRNNHTGYAQVLEETSGNAVIDSGDADGDGRTDDFILSPETRIQYTIGDDVISQTTSTCSGGEWSANASGTQCLLYDGHGSTRQMAAPDQSVVDSYDYDAYGVMLGSGANLANAAGTNLLYSGEQYDSSLSQYYLRARYYDQSNGRFTSVDPFAGNTNDPQSLHKYTYCHNDPVNSVDPSGKFSLVEVLIRAAISALLMRLIAPNVGRILKGLIPDWVLECIDTAIPRAVMLGLGIWGNGGLGEWSLGLGAAFGAFTEVLYAPGTGGVALYTGWGGAVGWQGSKGAGVSGSLYGGLVYGAKRSTDYENLSFGVSIPVSVLPKPLRTKIHLDVFAILARNLIMKTPGPGMEADMLWVNNNRAICDGCHQLAAEITRRESINIMFSQNNSPRVVTVGVSFGETLIGTSSLKGSVMGVSVTQRAPDGPVDF